MFLTGDQSLHLQSSMFSAEVLSLKDYVLSLYIIHLIFLFLIISYDNKPY